MGFGSNCGSESLHDPTIKLHKFWSNYVEDTLLVSAVIIAVWGLYLLAAYLFISTF
jgi:hypothetical protein